MKLERNLKVHLGLISLVPLVNVLFLVLAFFALSSRFVLQPGLAVSLPVSSFSIAPPREPQIVSVTAAPVPAIYFRDQRVTIDQLGERLGEGAPRERSLIVKADRSTPYEVVTQIINTALAHGWSVVLAAEPETR